MKTVVKEDSGKYLKIKPVFKLSIHKKIEWLLVWKTTYTVSWKDTNV